MTDVSKFLDNAAQVLDAKGKQAYQEANKHLRGGNQQEKWDKFLDTEVMREAIWNAYKNNPVITPAQLMDTAGKNLTAYQKEQNLKWCEAMTMNAEPMTTWYYEHRDTLFVRKGLGWALVGGGFKESA